MQEREDGERRKTKQELDLDQFVIKTDTLQPNFPALTSQDSPVLSVSGGGDRTRLGGYGA